VWTWVALCADTKLVPCWHVDNRSGKAASAFMHDLADRLTHRVQLTTDGHKAYLDAVDDAFGRNIDYARLIKMYGATREGEKRYSPSKITGTKRGTVFGNPDMDQVSTSYVERQNLTMRMHMRRFTRLTNGFSKKVENHCHAISLHYMYYNFAKINKTFKTTPDMAAGLSDLVWEM
jgi:IS1 family transposase